METNNITTNTTTTARTAKALQTLYFTRTAFSVIWITLIAIYAKTSPQIAAILLVIYPAWDVVGTLLDIRANRSTGFNS
jgi:tryptophan-rich sensory protein